VGQDFRLIVGNATLHISKNTNLPNNKYTNKKSSDVCRKHSSK
jgi:hypothetical protein